VARILVQDEKPAPREHETGMNEPYEPYNRDIQFILLSERISENFSRFLIQEDKVVGNWTTH
jgi:hypothetical protein